MSDILQWYAALKNHDATAYRETINQIEAVTLANDVPTKLAAKYEEAAVFLVCNLLGLKA